MENPYNSETGCCPKFDPTPWDNTEHSWNDKIFLRDRVKCICHIPLNFGQVVKRMMNVLVQADALPPNPPIMLCDETSAWHTDIYVEATKEIPGGKNKKICGSFLTKVFDGPYKEVKNFYAQMAEYVKAQGKQPQKLYAYYAYCPKCAEHYGRNHIVMVAEV